MTNQDKKAAGGQWQVTSHDEEGQTVVATGVSKQEAEAVARQEEDELREAFGTEGDFRVERV